MKLSFESGLDLYQRLKLAPELPLVTSALGQERILGDRLTWGNTVEKLF